MLLGPSWVLFVRTLLLDTLVMVLNFQDDGPKNWLKTGLKWPFLDTKLAIERARRLEIAQNLLHVMRNCCPVILSYLDVNLGPCCGRKEFLRACLLLLLAAKMCSSPLEPKVGL